METKRTQPIFPWYKERLQTKYRKRPTNKTSSVSSCLCFANMSLDDFSDCSSVLSKDRSGFSPVIFNGTPNSSITCQKPRRSISKQHACFSKQMIQKQIRKEYVTSVENKLKQHPLAMYPDYKNHLTPELFDKVVSILDPNMYIKTTSALIKGDSVQEGKAESCVEPSMEEEQNKDCLPIK
ncbi:protein FAM47E isoform X2 [Mastacembelus armatus]|nr:protein FAM47E-like isoform X2 [Mastacembelus armatus]